MLNRVVLQGRLTAPPELRYTQNEKPVTSFTLAVERDFDKQTDFINCVAWQKTAEFVSKYFEKGNMAIVAGRLQVRKWLDKNEQSRTSVEIVVDNVYFGGSKKESQEKFEDYEGTDGGLPF